MKISIKEGFDLNPNKKVVDAITKRCNKNDGLCPCTHEENDGDLHCPCESYRLRDKCICGLYIKKLKYVDTKIVFSEVPDEITLAISISNCPCKCEGCHSQYLWDDIGTILDNDSLSDLINKNKGISCVCFMGGDSNPNSINELGKFVKEQFKGLKTAWYSGKKEISNFIDISNFDFIKIGPFIKKRGPLDSPLTNQIFYKIENNKLFDKTHLFYK